MNWSFQMGRLVSSYNGITSTWFFRIMSHVTLHSCLPFHKIRPYKSGSQLKVHVPSRAIKVLSELTHGPAVVSSEDPLMSVSTDGIRYR